MTSPLPNYLLTYRKKAGLTQGDIAYLLGKGNGTKISGYERFKRLPSLKTAFGYIIIFNTSPKIIFGGEFQKVEVQIKRQAENLINKLQEKLPDQAISKKIEFLRSIIEPPPAQK